MKTSDGKVCLLDVNVLIALIDPAHHFHGAAHAWFKAHRHGRGWATCPITENGCLRIMSSPGYPFPGLTVKRVQDILAELVRVEGHRFWPDSVSMLASGKPDLGGIGHKRVTDLYLLNLAVSNQGCLITFDRNIPSPAVPAFQPENLEILASDE